MDIKWKDGQGNILNANNQSIKYLDARENIKTIITKEDVKKITIEDGIMHIFKDFESDLQISIVVPKKNKRDAIKIFNEYDKTGVMLKGRSNNFLLDLILESSMTTGNPLFGICAIIFITSILILIANNILGIIFGQEIGNMILRFIVFGYAAYAGIVYILVRIKRIRIRE